MRRRSSLLVLLVTVAVLGGCAADDGAAPVTPAGWQRVEEGALSFAVPGEWVEAPQSDDLWSVGRADAADLDQASFLVVGAPGFGDEGAEMGFHTFVAGAAIGGWGYSSTGRSTPVAEETLEVWRNDFTYDGVTGVFWSAGDPRTGRTVALQLTGEDLPVDLVEQIEASIAVLDVDPA